MTCQWKDKYVIYRLVGPFKINLHWRAVFSGSRLEFFTVRIFSQPVIADHYFLYFFPVRERAVFYNFVI